MRISYIQFFVICVVVDGFVYKLASTKDGMRVVEKIKPFKVLVNLYYVQLLNCFLNCGLVPT